MDYEHWQQKYNRDEHHKRCPKNCPNVHQKWANEMTTNYPGYEGQTVIKCGGLGCLSEAAYVVKDGIYKCIYRKLLS